MPCTVLPGLGKAWPCDLNLVTESGTGFWSPRPDSSTGPSGPSNLVNPSSQILNSVLMASEPYFIRVAIQEMTVSSKDWIDEGSICTWRGRGRLW